MDEGRELAFRLLASDRVAHCTLRLHPQDAVGVDHLSSLARDPRSFFGRLGRQRVLPDVELHLSIQAQHPRQRDPVVLPDPVLPGVLDFLQAAGPGL